MHSFHNCSVESGSSGSQNSLRATGRATTTGGNPPLPALGEQIARQAQLACIHLCPRGTCNCNRRLTSWCTSCRAGYSSWRAEAQSAESDDHWDVYTERLRQRLAKPDLPSSNAPMSEEMHIAHAARMQEWHRRAWQQLKDSQDK